MVETNGNGTNGLPTWAKAIVAVGVIPACLVYLIWFVTERTDRKLDMIRESIIVNDKQIDAHIATSDRAIQEQHEHNLRGEIYQRLNCVNTSKTRQQQEACLSVR